MVEEQLCRYNSAFPDYGALYYYNGFASRRPHQPPINGRTTTAETGNATFPAAPLGDLVIYNQGLQSATPKGFPGNYYDLSTHDVNGTPTPRNIANCYLISAPGYYCVPLVYGNAVKNGVANTHAYISQAPTGPRHSCYQHLGRAVVDPQSYGFRANGYSVRPVSE